MKYYCLGCDADCGAIPYCCDCEENDDKIYEEHPGYITDEEIDAEIRAEEFWEDYTS